MKKLQRLVLFALALAALTSAVAFDASARQGNSSGCYYNCPPPPPSTTGGNGGGASGGGHNSPTGI